MPTRPDRLGGFVERTGVCRDFVHLAITLCRCMNIPARYCTGYLGDIGVPPGTPMDFSAWFEAYLGGRWYAFDARHNIAAIGRILMATGRDATDVALSTSFGARSSCTSRSLPKRSRPPPRTCSKRPGPIARCEVDMPPASHVAFFADALPRASRGS